MENDYYPDKNLSLDESVVLSRGRLVFNRSTSAINTFYTIRTLQITKEWENLLLHGEGANRVLVLYRFVSDPDYEEEEESEENLSSDDDFSEYSHSDSESEETIHFGDWTLIADIFDDKRHSEIYETTFSYDFHPAIDSQISIRESFEAFISPKIVNLLCE
ncbi:hypothetical protein QE152_g8066 [Popillia japonica]|uniref:DUF4178 domain-containing protein n=1 Tax=Popillia japonica TaxID=7064 RepID=A0AAW1MDB2_POPJA